MSCQLQVGEAGLWYPDLPPAMHRRDRRAKHLGDGGCTPEPIDDFVGIGFHVPEYATFANSSQALFCDNRLCDKRNDVVEDGMDRASIIAFMDANGLNNRKLADLLGITEDKVSKSLSDTAKPRKWQQDEVLKLIQLMKDDEPRVRTEVRATGMTPQEVKDAWGSRDATAVPLFGSAYGGDWDDLEGVEMTELHLSEVLDNLARPPSLAGDLDAYAVEIVSDSMSPRFEVGERAFVSPKSPVRPGDDVVVQLIDPTADEDLRSRVTMVLIKRLVKRTPAYIELRQFNPDRTFRVPAERIAISANLKPAIHRVRGRL